MSTERKIDSSDGTAIATLTGVSLDDVMRTEELTRRPSRPPDYEAENRALVALARQMAEMPQTILQKLVNTALDLCRADSAGISIEEMESGKNIFRWHATTGAFARYLGGTMPRRLSPCGTVLDRNATQLMANPVRYYPDIAKVPPHIAEVLLVPFYRGDVAIGTVWVIAHTPDRKFEAEDARLMQSLSRFASAAVQTLSAARDARRAEAELRLALDVARMGTWSWNPTARDIAADARCREICGLDSGATLTLPDIVSRVHPDDWPRVETALRASLRSESTGLYAEEFRLVHGDGSMRWVISRAQTAFEGEPRRPTTVLGTVLDITERKRAEDALREAGRRKDEFLATLAHELRNPLAPIRNAVQVMRLADGDATQRAQAREMIERQVSQMVRIVEDLLDVARIVEHKVALHKERTNVADAVGTAVDTLRSVMEARRHELTVVLPPEPLFVDADPARLTQVVANLLHNAAKYTPDGGHIELRAEHDASRGQAVIAVRDDGIGITPDLLPRVFEMYTQGDGLPERSRSGLGVGLSLVWSLVQMQGGTVEAHSPGRCRGSEFVVRLPLAERISGRGEDARAAPRPPASRPRRILVVDDNHDQADSLGMLLRLQGHDVIVAHDGPGAVDAAISRVPDVALVDIGLPGLSGHQVARRIRKRPELRHMVLVAQTGWGQDEDRRRSGEAGFDHHLVKPVDLDSVERILAAIQPRDGALARKP